MEATIADMKIDMEQLRERWEQVQSRLVAEVERTNAENARLTQAMSDQQEKAQKERDAAESRYRQRQAELGVAQLELAVAKENVRTARASRDAIMAQLELAVAKEDVRTARARRHNEGQRSTPEGNREESVRGTGEHKADYRAIPGAD
jgi:galactokinase